MNHQIIILDATDGENLSGLELTDEQANLLHLLQENDFLEKNILFIDVTEIDFEKP